MKAPKQPHRVAPEKVANLTDERLLQALGQMPQHPVLIRVAVERGYGLGHCEGGPLDGADLWVQPTPGGKPQPNVVADGHAYRYVTDGASIEVLGRTEIPRWRYEPDQ